MIDISKGTAITRRDMCKGIATCLASGCAPYIAKAGEARRELGHRCALLSSSDSLLPGVVASVIGNGSTGCVFTSSLYSSFYFINGFLLTAWAKFTPNTRGHFFTFGGDTSGISLGHGASGASERNGNYINGLFNAVFWLPSNELVSDGLWHHYAFLSFTSTGYSQNQGTKILIDGNVALSNSRSCHDARDLNVVNSNITLLGVFDGAEQRFLTGNVTRFCVYDSAKEISFVQADYNLGKDPPNRDGLIHYYNGEKSNGTLIDWIRGCNMEPKNGATFSNDIPFTQT